LTLKKADFEISCSNYNRDEEEYIRKRKKLIEEINSSYSKDKFLAWYYDSRGIFSTIKTNQFQSIPNKREFKKSKPIGIILISLAIIISIQILSDRKDIFLTRNLLTVLLFPLFLLIPGIYILLNRKIYFSWNEYSMNFKNEEVFYNDIILIGKAEFYAGGRTKNSIIIGTKSKGVLEFNTNEVDITPDEIAEIIKRKTLPNTV